MEFLVTNTSGSGEGSLRNAVLLANATPGEDTILFSGALFNDGIADTIFLTAGELTLTGPTIIHTDGASDSITISGQDARRILTVATGADVRMDGLTLADGFASNGGAILNLGTLTLTNSTLSGNVAINNGGAIINGGTLTLANTTLSNNQGGAGGGLYNFGSGTVNIFNSTFSGNLSFGSGGAIYNSGSNLTIRNSTITLNTAASGGAGLFNDGAASGTRVGNTIISGNNGQDVTLSSATSLQSLGGNLIGTVSASSVFTATGDLTNVTNPGLGVLANNGGPTQTHALLSTSSAINGGLAVNIPSTQDQTGGARVSGGVVDIGAVEFGLPVLSISAERLVQDEGNSGTTRFVYTLTLSQAAIRPVDVTLGILDGSTTDAADLSFTSVATIPTGATTVQVFVDVVGDTTIEEDETFVYGILSATNADIDPVDNAIAGTIRNDDFPPPPTLTLTPTTLSLPEGNSGNTPYTFTLNLSEAATTDITVNLALSGDATVASGDVADFTTTVVIPAGQTSAQVVVNAIGDTEIEADETFVYSVTSTSGGAVELIGGSATGTLVNDDVLLTGSILGTKFNDLNLDGDLDAGEPGLSNWVIYLDSNDNGLLDTGEVSTLTGSDGSFQFLNLAPGTYSVREVPQPGFTQTTPPSSLVLESGENEVVNLGSAVQSPVQVVAEDDVATTRGQEAVAINVLANDSGPLAITLLTNPLNGIAVLDTKGTPDVFSDDEVIYTPNPSFCGEDSFTYEIRDAAGNVDTATVTVTVLGAVLTGNASPNTLIGGNCADILDGAAGNDTLIGVAGNDTLIGGSGADRFVVAVGSSSAVVIQDFVGVGQGTLFQGAIAEVDTIQFMGEGAIAQNLLAQQVGTDLILQFEGQPQTQVTLQNFRLENLDNLTRATGSNVDVANILFYNQTSPHDSFDVFNVNSNQARLWNRNSVTFLNGLNNSTSGFDNSNDVINAQGGNDLVNGLSGNDLLRGEAGNDTLLGGAGNDTLSGGAGDDSLTGGSGSDVFSFRSERPFATADFGVDTIVDFVGGSDRIALSRTSFTAIPSALVGSLTAAEFAAVGSDAAAAVSTAIFVYNTSNGVLSYNPNTTDSGFGSGGAIAILSNRPSLSAANFLVVA